MKSSPLLTQVQDKFEEILKFYGASDSESNCKTIAEELMEEVKKYSSEIIEKVERETLLKVNKVILSGEDKDHTTVRFVNVKSHVLNELDRLEAKK